MTSTITSDARQWDTCLTAHQGHLLQSWAWGQLKSHFGWIPHRVQAGPAAAQILFKRLPLGFTIGYIPKGPLVYWQKRAQLQPLFEAIHAAAKKQRAIFLKIEPDVWQTENALAVNPDIPQAAQAKAATQFLAQAGFSPADSIQPQTTIVIDIRGDEESILAAMKQKTRYNIRLADRKGVTIRAGSQTEVATFFDLAQLTASRDDFGIHSLSYYQHAYNLFAPGQSVLLIAEFEGTPLAGLMAFCQGKHAYYFYGASSNTHRNLMATYLIQWEAICWAKRQGCSYYDLWGIPNADAGTLEEQFQQRSDGLWGVYRFKRGFGGQVVRSVGAFDYVYIPWLYRLYKLRRQSSGES